MASLYSIVLRLFHVESGELSIKPLCHLTRSKGRVAPYHPNPCGAMGPCWPPRVGRIVLLPRPLLACCRVPPTACQVDKRDRRGALPP